MTQEASKFQLSAELKDHFKEVRSVAAYPVIEGAVLTSSLDNTAKLWQPKKTEKGITYEVVTTFVGHADFVIDVAYYPFHETANIVTVSHDKSIIFWSMDGTPVKTIPNAHDAQISCLCIGTDGLIATGSWDKTAKIWKDGNCIHHLKGHEMNVLAVQFLSNGTVVTGCGDGSFKIWKDGQDVVTVKKHTSCVRAFCELPGIGFLSVSNDGTVRSWMLNGQEVSEFQAHNNLIYSVCILDGDQTVTSSEDKTVRIWKYGKCVQTMDHPGCVWKVAILANGDMATACADCTARIWTKKSERAANEEVVKSYNEALKNSKKTVGGVDVNSLPLPEVLNQIKGKKDGEIKLVNEQGAAIAYSWSAQSGKWEKFGEVTDGTPGVGQNFAGKEYLNGKMYDYVFNVEIQEGVTHKLGYNMGENPYTVAQQFIHDYQLSQYALDTVAKFIIQNTPQNAQQKPLPLDPFTGSSAMRSSQLLQRQGAAASSTGGAGAPAPNKITSQNAFSEYAKENLAKQKEQEEREKQKHAKHFPRNFEQHDVANYKGIEKKIREFNASVSPAEALNENELKVLGDMVTIVTEVTLERKPFQAHHYKVLDKLLSWNKKYVFPVLDFLRVLILLPFVAQFYSSQNIGGQENNSIVQYVLRVCFAEDSNDILLMMGLRCLANMFVQNPLRYLMIKNSMDILSTVNFKVNEPSEARIIQGYSILLHNYSIFFGSQPNQEAFVEGLLDSIKLMIQNKTHLGHDNYYLLFCAIGNLVHQDKKYLAIAQGMQLEQLAASYVFNPNAKLAGVASQIQQLLKK